MLRFLQKFRRQNLKESRMKKVVLYALGEILLVVIGILIAVQINNWNNARKFSNIERITLTRLTEDLENDSKRYDFLIERLTERINRCDSALQLLEKQRSIQDKLDVINIHLINYFLVESYTITYEEMLNTGRLYSLKDKELRSSIVAYYRDVNKWSTYIERDNNQLRNIASQPHLNDVWVIQRRIWNDKTITPKEFPWLNQPDAKQTIDLEALFIKARSTYSSHKRTISFLSRRCTGFRKKLEASIQ